MTDPMNRAEVSQNTGTDVLPEWASNLGVALRFVARFLPSATAKFMATIWFKPFMPKQKSHISEWQNSADVQLDLVKGQAFLFEGNSRQEQQEKPLVVCVHGWRGRAHQLRRFLPPLIDNGFRVVMVNLPGHNDGDPNQTHIYECADVIKEISQQLGKIDTIIAHSFGAPASTLSLNENNSVRKLVVLAGNFDIAYLLKQYAGAFGLDHLVSRIDGHLKRICDKRIFKGAWENLTLETVIQKLDYAQDVQFWHDLEDTEINIDANQKIHQYLLNKQKISHLNEFENVGHFNILKSKHVITSIVNGLVDR